MIQSGLATDPSRLLIVILASTGGCFLLFLALGFAIVVALPLALILAVALFIVVCSTDRCRRRRRGSAASCPTGSI